LGWDHAESFETAFWTFKLATIEGHYMEKIPAMFSSKKLIYYFFAFEERKTPLG